jgi:hypothetical protein
MTGGGASSGGPVRPVVALGLGVVSYAALAIFGLGMVSLVLNRDVIEVRDLGQVPGVIGMLLSTALFAGAMWPVLRSARPSYVGALGGAAAAYLGYLAGLLFGAVVSGADPAAAFAAVGNVAVSWFGAVLAVAGGIAGWGAIALVRTRAGRPRWPWEDDEEL